MITEDEDCSEDREIGRGRERWSTFGDLGKSGQGEMGVRVDIGSFGHDRSRRVAESSQTQNKPLVLSDRR